LLASQFMFTSRQVRLDSEPMASGTSCKTQQQEIGTCAGRVGRYQ
jgi:hypothetical protein